MIGWVVLALAAVLALTGLLLGRKAASNVDATASAAMTSNIALVALINASLFAVGGLVLVDI